MTDKYTGANGGTQHGFKNQADEDEHRCQLAFMNQMAKLGVPEAQNVQIRGTVAELHEARKVLRRASNKLRADIGMKSPDDEQLLAMTFIGNKIARCEEMIDGLQDSSFSSSAQGPDDWRGPDGERIKVMRNSADFREHYNRQAARDGSTGEGINLADFLRGVANMSTTPAVRNALSVGTNSAGGFNVPSVVMPQILEAMAPVSSLLSAGAGIVQVDYGAKSFTTAAISTIPTAAWRLENGNVAESDPAFRGVVGAPQSLAFLFKVSRELLADAPNITQGLYLAIAQAFAKELDRAGLRGSGTAPEPRGILNTSGIQPVGNGTNGAALAGYANFFSAASAILAADAPMPTAAIMSPRSLVKLGGLVDSTGQPLRVPQMLENLKFLATSQVPNNLTVGSSSDCSEIYVGDFTRLAFMFRESMSIQLLAERYADTGQVGFVCHVRADVLLQYPAAFAVVTGVRP